MSDLKSKLPDMNELSSMAGKLFKDIKSSVCSIMDDYKQKHPAKPDEDVKTEAQKPVANPEVVAKAEAVNAEEAVKAAKKPAAQADVENKEE